MKRRKFFALFLICAMIVSGFGGLVTAKAADAASGDIYMMPGTKTLYPMAAGGTSHFRIPIKAVENLTISSDVFATVTTNDKIFDTTDAKLTCNGQEVKRITSDNTQAETYVEFDLTLKDSVLIGTYNAEIKFSFTGMKFEVFGGEMQQVNGATLPFQIRVVGQKAPAQMTVQNFKYDEAASAIGSRFKLEFDTKNAGEITAYNTFMTVDYGESGIVADYSVPTMKLGDVRAGASMHHELSLRVLPTATVGLKTIKVTYEYQDENGEKKPLATVEQYINVVAVNTAETNDAKLTAASDKLNVEVDVNSTLNLEIELENVGKRTAENIFVLVQKGIGAEAGILPEYGAEGVPVEYVNAGDKAKVSIPLSITKSASAGLRELDILVNYEDSAGNKLMTVAKAYITVKQAEEKPKPEVKNAVVISNVTQSPEQLMAGDVVTVKFTVTNNGSNDISDLQIYGEELSSNGFEPLSADVRNKIGVLKKGEAKEVTMKFRLGSSIPEGMNELHLAASYVDANDAQQKESTTVYILNVKKVTEEQIKNSVAISGISQSPSSPIGGENVTVSFTVTNNGTKEITEVKFRGLNLASNNFEPVNSEVYTKVGTIAPGASKKVSMTFKVGEEIAEGFNMLKLELSYKDGNGDIQTEETAMYILNVKSKAAATSGKPKLIVDSFSTSADELRAGESFEFTFVLKNTHASKTAKNITVTVLQEQDIFSATTGSNSFYVDAIEPGATMEHTIKLKVKSDTATGAYDLKIKVGYEYDDMSQADLQAGGATEELPIKLQAVENSRPAVQNLAIGYGWDTATINQATTLMFDFYNMGKSALNNVYVTLEGDFKMETGTSQIIGSVSAGSSNYQEISIIPTVEGTAKGKLIVHFEDSNGDEVTKEFELPETYVQGEPNIDWNPGIDDPNMGGDLPVGGDDVVKEPLMPVWAYIACLAAALVVGMLVTRGIIIAVYKKKHRGSDEF